MTKVFIIKYDVHCKLQNFFGKETKVKNCLSELHAKVKLNDFVKEKYGIEFTHIIVHECKEDNDFLKMFGDILNGKDKFNGGKDPLSDLSKDNPLTDLLFKDIKNGKKKN